MGHNRLHQTTTHVKGIQLSYGSHGQTYKIYTPDPYDHENDGTIVGTTIYGTCRHEPQNAKVHYLR
jgi:hypothetical protein